MSHTSRTRERQRFAAAVAALGLLPALAACSSSSSGGSAASPTASLSPVPGDTEAGTFGPNGVITKPTYNPPESTSPGGSTVYPHVSGKLEQTIANHVVTMDGVARVTNYPQFKQIQVYFDKGATDEQRQAVYRYITSKDPAAAG